MARAQYPTRGDHTEPESQECASVHQVNSIITYIHLQHQFFLNMHNKTDLHQYTNPK